MKIQNQIIKIAFVLLCMVIGKVCGYSEEFILDLVKWYLGFEIMANIIFKVNTKKIKLAVSLFTKN